MNHKGTQTLETQRLILRRFAVSDAHNMFKNWASDSRVTEFLTWPAHKSEEITQALLQSWVENYEKADYYHWTIELKEISEVIGSIAVVQVNEHASAATLGYCIGCNWWGQGLVPEAVKAVVRYLFEEAGFERIAACHARENEKSGRVMQKIGMQYEGTHRKSGLCNYGIVDEVWYSILKNEFEATKA